MVDKQDTATTIREVDTDDNEDHFALIVEDDTVNQNYMTKALTKRGYICKIASTVTDAITHIDELIKNETYFEVIFLDIFLENDQYGVDLLKYRKDNKIDDIGVCIIMTGNEELHIIQECNKYNIQNYIRKPVTSSNLEYEIMRVNAIVKKQKCPIKGYKNERKLGQGGMGEVFLVKHKQTKMLYAMKRVQVQSDDKSYNSEERFHKGCKAPTILELKDSKMHDGYIYMIIEYAEHGTLSDWITKQKTNIKNYVLNVDLVLKWMCEMFIGLFILHDKSLIHRDIKSDNLFLCKDFVLKIGDLGVARAIERVANTVVGTHHYMAPEIHRKEEYGQKVDIWAAGIVLYEIVMFEKPFDGSADEIIYKINKLNFKQLPKSIDQRIHTLLKHTLNPDVSLRMSSKEILNLNFMQEVLNKIYEEIRSNISNILNETSNNNSNNNNYNKSFNQTVKIDQKIFSNNNNSNININNYHSNNNSNQNNNNHNHNKNPTTGKKRSIKAENLDPQKSQAKTLNYFRW